MLLKSGHTRDRNSLAVANEMIRRKVRTWRTIKRVKRELLKDSDKELVRCIT